MLVMTESHESNPGLWEKILNRIALRAIERGRGKTRGLRRALTVKNPRERGIGSA